MFTCIYIYIREYKNTHPKGLQVCALIHNGASPAAQSGAGETPQKLYINSFMLIDI